MHPHLDDLHRALRAEEAWQRAEHEALLRLPVDGRVAAGVSQGPFTVDTVEDAGRGRVVVRLKAPKGVVLPDGISAGDPVVLGPIGSADDGPTGVSLGAERNVHVVLLDVDDPADVEGLLPLSGPRERGPRDRRWLLTKRFDATTFVRYRQALEAADRKPSALRDVLLGERVPSPAETPRKHVLRLDPSQEDAARTALGAVELGLVHGPPGTGKTEVITALLRALVAEGDRPWALADSNAAVDHLAVRATRAGLDVVRLGHPMRVGSEASSLTIEARIQRGPMAPVLKDLDREMVRARNDRTRQGAEARRQIYAERDKLYKQAKDAVLTSAQAIASTLGTLAREAGALPKARTAVVDEATQAIEPAVWTAVPWVERLFLVGDPNQLGPVVMEPGNVLQRSLLDRLLATDVVPMPMLTTQRRMHADVQALVQPVYEGRLQAHADVAGHLLADLPGVAKTELTTRPTLWIDTAGAGMDEARDPTTMSLYNRGEVAVVRAVVRQLREAGVRPEDIAVIAPYSAQVARLQGDELEGVEVATVNAFQGREKEAVVCTFVRSNADRELGFVADERRLTVALTRARRLLVCTGDSSTLCAVAPFARVLDAMAGQAAIVSVFEEPWNETVG